MPSTAAPPSVAASKASSALVIVASRETGPVNQDGRLQLGDHVKRIVARRAIRGKRDRYLFLTHRWNGCDAGCHDLVGSRTMDDLTTRLRQQVEFVRLHVDTVSERCRRVHQVQRVRPADLTDVAGGHRVLHALGALGEMGVESDPQARWRAACRRGATRANRCGSRPVRSTAARTRSPASGR